MRETLVPYGNVEKVRKDSNGRERKGRKDLHGRGGREGKIHMGGEKGRKDSHGRGESEGKIHMGGGSEGKIHLGGEGKERFTWEGRK